MNEYSEFSFELDIELNDFLALFNVWMNNQNLSPKAISKWILIKKWITKNTQWWYLFLLWHGLLQGLFTDRVFKIYLIYEVRRHHNAPFHENIASISSHSKEVSFRKFRKINILYIRLKNMIYQQEEHDMSERGI